MSAIVYLKGDATLPAGPGNRVIAHVCNDVGGWGRGFVTALSKRSAKPEQAFRAWYAGRVNNDFALGAVQFVELANDLWVANMVGQHKIATKATVARGELPPVRYEAISTALSSVGKFAKSNGASVHMPRIGCGLAGGKWEVIEPLLEAELLTRDISVFVYDFD
jgi:O-acetyl-ADP-ribose deacetylase (regulator of RNase III)